jgi:hypothetical protein
LQIVLHHHRHASAVVACGRSATSASRTAAVASSCRLASLLHARLQMALHHSRHASAVVACATSSSERWPSAARLAEAEGRTAPDTAEMTAVILLQTKPTAEAAGALLAAAGAAALPLASVDMSSL